MIEILTVLNEWISSHQALVAIVGIPLLTALVTAFISWRTTIAGTRTQRSERKLMRTIKLAEFRQDWINALRDDLATYSALTWSADLQDDVAARKEQVSLQSRILMRMNPLDPDYGALCTSLLNPVADPESGREALALIGQRFLKREWDRIKDDLEAVEPG